MKALRREGRRGVSPVIATLLLIVIAVAAAVLVYMWVVGYATQTRPTTPEATERLKIEVGVLKASSPYVTLQVRNVGGSTVEVKRVYILDVSEGLVAYADLSPTVTIDPGDVQQVQVTSLTGGSAPTAGQTYIVRIVTSLGNEFSIQLKAKA
jgi:flagellin-like protein